MYVHTRFISLSVDLTGKFVLESKIIWSSPNKNVSTKKWQTRRKKWYIGVQYLDPKAFQGKPTPVITTVVIPHYRPCVLPPPSGLSLHTCHQILQSVASVFVTDETELYHTSGYPGTVDLWYNTNAVQYSTCLYPSLHYAFSFSWTTTTTRYLFPQVSFPSLPYILNSFTRPVLYC